MESISEKEMDAFDIKIHLLTTQKLYDLIKIVITQFVVLPHSPGFVPNNFRLLAKIKSILSRILNIHHRKDIPNMTQNPNAIKDNTDKFDFIKMKNICME